MKKFVIFILLFTSAYLIGTGAAYLKNRSDAEVSGVVRPSPGTDAVPVSSDGNWGLKFQEDGRVPVGNATFEELAQYDAYYAQNTKKKVLYLTFDAGYENGNTGKILDTLKKQQTPATFFVVGPYIESEPELVKRMVNEGHTVGNHTWNHPDMAKISSSEAFEKELKDVEEAFRKTTGQELSRYYRPPQGKYNENNLKMAQEFGYRTFFWSLAHVDWNQTAQPSREDAMDLLTRRIHPGAIVLLHSTSRTNADILDDLITAWKEMGYEILPLSEII